MLLRLLLAFVLCTGATSCTVADPPRPDTHTELRDAMKRDVDHAKAAQAASEKAAADQQKALDAAIDGQ